MEAQETLTSLSQRKKDLFEQAHRNPELKHKLLLDPQAEAKKCGVTLEEEEVLALKQVGVLAELGDEITYGRLFSPPPLFYPRDIWAIQELLNIFATLIADGIPAPTSSNANEVRSVSAGVIDDHRLHPEWYTYKVKLLSTLGDRLLATLGVANKYPAGGTLIHQQSR